MLEGISVGVLESGSSTPGTTGSPAFFIAFLAYCLHVTLARRLRDVAPGLTPRSVLEKLAAIQMLVPVNPVWPNAGGCITPMYSRCERKPSWNTTAICGPQWRRMRA
mgnify:CR=1 FL=1